MKKIKYLVSILLVAAFVFIIPNIAKATSETWKDTTQNIDWSYNVDNNGNIIYLKCETSSVSGTVKIPSKINDKTYKSAEMLLDGKFVVMLEDGKHQVLNEDGSILVDSF